MRENSSNFQPILNDLIRLKAIKKENKTYKLSSKYTIGTIDVAQSGTGFLTILGDKKSKDLLIEQKNLLDSHKGDLVVARKIYSQKSRPKAKVIYILKRAYNSSIIYTVVQHNRIVGVNIRTSLTHNISASQKSLKKLPINTVLKIDNDSGKILEV